MIESPTIARSILAAATAAATVGVGHLADAEVHGWASGSKTASPSMAELIPDLEGAESYTERYTFSANLDSGGQLGMDFTISNLGWGDAHGAVQVRVESVGPKDYKFSKKLSKDEWSYSKKKFQLDIAHTKVTAVGANRFRLQHKADGVKIDVTLTNTMPMWKPGDGRIDTEEGYYKFHLLASQANLKGKVYLGGKWHKVTGSQTGYADHVATTAAPFDLGTRFMRMRTTRKGVSIIWREIKATEALGGKSMTWVMVGYKNKIVFSDPDAELTFGRTLKDPKTDYTVPLTVQLKGKSGKDSVTLVARGKEFERKDLLASYGSAARAVASTMTEPYSYTVPVSYKLKMTVGGATAVVGGKSHFVADILN